ncbi:MAG: hypothetical protein M3R21_09525, partial [Candidatus Dormibacteraeota bacterium]|nr:hypothetical protein [Candidatus Dormibacteraeota bacterium]
MRRQGLSEATHALVMTLSGSLLGQFASETGTRQLPIQLNGAEHIPGRMSSPSTRVFLLPAALALGRDGGLVDMVRTLQAAYRLAPGLTHEERAAIVAHDPYLRLAAWLSAQMDEGRGMVLLDVAP